MKEIEELRGSIVDLTALLYAVVEAHSDPAALRHRCVEVSEQAIAWLPESAATRDWGVIKVTFRATRSGSAARREGISRMVAPEKRKRDCGERRETSRAPIMSTNARRLRSLLSSTPGALGEQYLFVRWRSRRSRTRLIGQQRSVIRRTWN
jgi:hypothetical protein